MKGIVSRVVSGATVVVVLMTVFVWPASAAVTPAVAPTVDVAFPTSNTFMRRGAIWVNGVACDPNASTTDATAGISRVQVFLGDRDNPSTAPSFRSGGFMGQATIGGYAMPGVASARVLGLKGDRFLVLGGSERIGWTRLR